MITNNVKYSVFNILANHHLLVEAVRLTPEIAIIKCDDSDSAAHLLPKLRRAGTNATISLRDNTVIMITDKAHKGEAAIEDVLKNGGE